jgi:hypothetical protein
VIPFYASGDPEKSDALDQHSPMATTHEVCYDPANPESQTYKVHLEQFSTGTPEQALEFLARLNIIITGNNLEMGSATYNLTHSVLKGEALRVFQTEAHAHRHETPANFGRCLQVLIVHFFPKQALCRQCHYLRHYV